MASTYSTNLKIELIGTGEQSGTWGNTTNTNLGTLIEEAIAGYVTQAVTDGAATVLTIPNGASSNGRNYVIELTGALTANRTVEVPAVDKPYIFFNNTSGGYSVTVKVSGQTGVTIANGKKAIVYTNSTDVIEVVNAPVSEAGTQTLSNKTLASPTVTGVATFAAGTVSAPALTTTGDTNTGIFFPAADTIAFAEGGVESMRIDSSGNVGVGTSSPSGRLHVRQDQDGTTRSILQNRNASGTPIVELDFITGAYDLSDTRYAYIQSGGSANQYLAFGNGQGASPTEKMRIDSAGNVGIGTNSPANTLDVKGTIRITNTSNTANYGTLADGGGLVITSANSNPMYLYTGGAERARISAAGGFMVGTTTDPGVGKISDSIGEVRTVPVNSQTGAYTAASSDAGKFISITTGGVTIATTTAFAVGQSVSIYNNSGSNQTITQGASVTIRQVGTANTGNRTLAQYGLCTLLCVASNTYVITGGGVT